MFHCHILDHADGGLMGTVLVAMDTGVGHRHPQPDEAASPRVGQPQEPDVRCVQAGTGNRAATHSLSSPPRPPAPAGRQCR